MLATRFSCFKRAFRGGSLFSGNFVSSTRKRRVGLERDSPLLCREHYQKISVPLGVHLFAA